MASRFGCKVKPNLTNHCKLYSFINNINLQMKGTEMIEPDDTFDVWNDDKEYATGIYLDSLNAFSYEKSKTKHP